MSIKQHGERAAPTITAAVGILIYSPCWLLEEASVAEGAGSLSYILWSSLGADRNILLTFFDKRGTLSHSIKGSCKGLAA